MIVYNQKFRGKTRNDDAGLVERIRSEIEQLILSGEIAPGDRLNELDLSTRFAVSRSAIREGVRALEEARLVQLIPNRGAVVRCLGLRDALELFEIRAGLARTAGRLLALRVSGAQIAELTALQHRLDVASNAGNTKEFHHLNLRFHDRLMELAGNPRLCEMDRTIRNELQLYVRRNVSSVAQLIVSNREHAAILKAVAAGNWDAAGTAFETHVLNGKKRLLHDSSNLDNP